MASLSDEEIRRALSRYVNMRPRRDVKLPVFKPMGPLVNASTPEELESETVEALIEDASAKESS